jgi:predicted dehydrogenase
MMKKLRFAVIGCGRLGGFHAQKLAASEDVALKAVVDPIAENRDRVAAECHTEARADFTGLFEQIDAAVIAAPTSLHHRVACEFLEAGVHLLVEKPLCTTHAQADELTSIARRRGVVLQVGHVERFNPAFQAAVPHLNAPKYIEASRANGFTFRSTDVGVVLDLMIHDIDLVLSLVRSPVRKVEALGVSVLGGHEDIANARLEFESGCVASLSASRVSYEPVRRMRAWSARAFADIDFATRTATLVRPSETLLRRRFDVDALTPKEVEYQRQHFADEHLPQEKLTLDAVDALALEINDFIGAIRMASEPRVNGEAGRDALGVAEQILSRIHDHCWDASIDGPTGPLALPRRHVIPAPHFDLAGIQSPIVREKAG